MQLLRNAGFNVDNHSEAMKNVIWSRAVQYGPGEVVNLFLEALRCMFLRYWKRLMRIFLTMT